VFAWSASRRPCLRLAVPAYFAPADTRTWQRLASPGSRQVSVAVVNPASGPGAGPDERLRRLYTAVRAGGTRVLGYVPTGYGTRPQADVLADVQRYRDWFGIVDVFFDEASPQAAHLPLYRGYTHAVRAHGGFVALNPGTVPDRGYADLADLLLTFEGTAEQYRAAPSPPGWLRALPPDRVWHLVHDTPASETRAVLSLARDRGAGHVYVTDGRLPQPWDHLPEAWSTELEQASSGRLRC